MKKYTHQKMIKNIIFVGVIKNKNAYFNKFKQITKLANVMVI